MIGVSRWSDSEGMQQSSRLFVHEIGRLSISLSGVPLAQCIQCTQWGIWASVGREMCTMPDDEIA